ncbi:MAG: hypothetical protein P1P69_04155 [Methanosarcinaceae archaeon]|nr:hypothetical protein [Methanosarcinaceae archaeon]
MSTLFPASINIPLWLIVVDIIAIIIIGAFAFLVTMFAMQIPFVTAQIKAQMKRSALVMMHYSDNRSKIFSPKRNGKKQQENTLALPASVGTKFDPSGSGIAEGYDKTSMYHYYSKATIAILTKHAKGVSDFVNFCNSKGVSITRELIDVLVVENCNIQDVYTKPMLERIMKNLPLQIRTEKEQWLDEDVLDSKYHQLEKHLDDLIDTNTTDFDNRDLERFKKEIEDTKEGMLFIKSKHDDLIKLHKLKKELVETENEIKRLKTIRSHTIDGIDIITGYLDENTRETVYTITRLQEDLKNLVITEGLFVYPTVHDFVFAVSALNSAGMTESINIARSDALEQNRDDQQGLTVMTLAGLAMLGIFVIAGIGLAYKIGFGT